MICWMHCSGSLLTAALAALGGDSTPPAFALLPIDNLGGQPAPIAAIYEVLAGELAAAGVALVPREALSGFVTRHRVRYTGGVTAELASAAANELGVQGVLVTSLESYADTAPLRMAATMRLVSAGVDPQILWFDGYSRRGDDSPGFLGLGLLNTPEQLQRSVARALAERLRAFLMGQGPRAGSCSPSFWHRPGSPFLREVPDWSQEHTVAVLPFSNLSLRRTAGSLAAMHLARQLHTLSGVRVMEPGVVRAQLLAHRVMVDQGVSTDVARLLIEALQVDWVVIGTVFAYADQGDFSPAPQVSLSASILDRQRVEITWHAATSGSGDDGLILFDVGRVFTLPELACKMSTALAETLVGPATGLRYDQIQQPTPREVWPARVLRTGKAAEEKAP